MSILLSTTLSASLPLSLSLGSFIPPLDGCRNLISLFPYRLKNCIAQPWEWKRLETLLLISLLYLVHIPMDSKPPDFFFFFPPASVLKERLERSPGSFSPSIFVWIVSLSIYSLSLSLSLSLSDGGYHHRMAKIQPQTNKQHKPMKQSSIQKDSSSWLKHEWLNVQLTVLVDVLIKMKLKTNSKYNMIIDVSPQTIKIHSLPLPFPSPCIALHSTRSIEMIS